MQRTGLDQLADELEAAIIGRDFYAARAAATMLVAFTGGCPNARASALLMRAPSLLTDDGQDDAAREAAWLASLPRPRRARRPDRPRAH